MQVREHPAPNAPRDLRCSNGHRQGTVCFFTYIHTETTRGVRLFQCHALHHQGYLASLEPSTSITKFFYPDGDSIFVGEGQILTIEEEPRPKSEPEQDQDAWIYQ